MRYDIHWVLTSLILSLVFVACKAKESSSLSADIETKFRFYFGDIDSSAPPQPEARIVLISTPLDAEKVSICPLDAATNTCQPNQNRGTKSLVPTSDKKIFQVDAKNPLPLAMGLKMVVAAFDGTDKQIYQSIIEIANPSVAPNPSPSPGGSNAPNQPLPAPELGAKDISLARMGQNGPEQILLSKVMDKAQFLLFNLVDFNDQGLCAGCDQLHDQILANPLLAGGAKCKAVHITMNIEKWLQNHPQSNAISFSFDFTKFAQTFGLKRPESVPSTFAIDQRGNVVTGATMTAGDLPPGFVDKCK